MTIPVTAGDRYVAATMATGGAALDLAFGRDFDDRRWRAESLIALAATAALGLIALAAWVVLGHEFAVRADLSGTAMLFLWTVMAAAFLLSPEGRRGMMPAAGLLLFSAALRLISAEMTVGISLRSDPMNYTNIAAALLDGRGMIVDDWRYGEGLRAYFPPLYPLLLAGFWGVFGHSAISTLVMNCVIDLIAAWAIADIGRRLGNARAAWIAAVLYLSWPAFAMAAGMVQKESLTILFVLLCLRSVVIWSLASDRTDWRHGARVGATWGLMALTQASLAVTPAFVAPLLIWRVGFVPTLRLGLAAAPFLLLVLAPWWARNWIVLGSFVPFTTASGMMTNVSLGALSVPFPSDLFDLPEPERAALMGDLARQAIRDNPLGFLRETLRSMAVGLAYEEAALARYRSAVPTLAAADHARFAVLLQGSYALLLAVGAWVAAIAARRRRVEPLLLYLFALMVSIALVNPWFEFGERHRHMLTPLLLMVAVGGVLQWRASRGLKSPPTNERVAA